MHAILPLHPGAVATAAGGEAVSIAVTIAVRDATAPRTLPFITSTPNSYWLSPSFDHAPALRHAPDRSRNLLLYNEKSPTFPVRKVGL